jgi:hypothetical protein
MLTVYDADGVEDDALSAEDAGATDCVGGPAVKDCVEF